MKLMIFVLSKVEKLNELMLAYSNANVRGSTIIESSGMAKSLIETGGSMMSYLRTILDPEHTESRTILTVCNDDQVQTIKNAITDVIGSLECPDTGILFTIPLDSVDGLVKSSGTNVNS